jgi:hypothetical protein
MYLKKTKSDIVMSAGKSTNVLNVLVGIVPSSNIQHVDTENTSVRHCNYSMQELVVSRTIRPQSGTYMSIHG